MTLSDFQRRADAVRSIPLETVLKAWGAQRDRRDRHQWRTDRGPLTVTGAKFFNWHVEEGGGGAIDLVMHLGSMEADAAIAWLQQHLGCAPAAASSACRVWHPSLSAASRGLIQRGSYLYPSGPFTLHVGNSLVQDISSCWACTLHLPWLDIRSSGYFFALLLESLSS